MDRTHAVLSIISSYINKQHALKSVFSLEGLITVLLIAVLSIITHIYCLQVKPKAVNNLIVRNHLCLVGEGVEQKKIDLSRVT